MPITPELHVAVMRPHGGIQRHALIVLVPIDRATRIPIHVEAPSVTRYGNAEGRIDAAGSAVFAPPRVIELADGVPEPGPRIHMPLSSAQKRADAMAVPCVLLRGDRLHRRLGEVISHHAGIALKATARHDHALVRFDANLGASVRVNAAEYRFRGRILHQGRQGALGFQGNGRQVV